MNVNPPARSHRHRAPPTVQSVAIERDDPPPGKVERFSDRFCAVLVNVPGRDDPVARLECGLDLLPAGTANAAHADLHEIMHAGIVKQAPHRLEKPSRRPLISSRKSICASIWRMLTSSMALKRSDKHRGH